MHYLCLLNKPIDRLLRNRFPRAWERFCSNLYEKGISVINCPVDTRNQEQGKFIYQDLKVVPTWIWRRYSEYVNRTGGCINSQLFCDTCADKRKTYQVLLTAHAITYLGSEYFSLSYDKQYLVKPRWGQRKEGIRVASGKQVMEMDDIFNENRIIQEYKQTRYAGKSSHDIRCIFFGKELIGSRIRWGSTIYDDRNNEQIILPGEIMIRVKKQATKLLSKTHTLYAIYSIDIGIEIKTGKPFVIECNSAVGVNSLLKVDPTGEITAQYILSIM